jgi:hypothetical protein
MSKYKKKNKRTGLGTGQACLGLNIKDQCNCPFTNKEVIETDSYSDVFYTCNINDNEECDLKHCKLKEFGRIIVDWVK